MTKVKGQGLEAKDSSTHNTKRLARLAAIQGLYQIALTEHKPAQIIKDFHEHPPSLMPEKNAGETLAGMDRELFAVIVTGVAEHSAALDQSIAGALDAKVSGARMETLLRAILRAGAYELQHHAQTPSAVVINDYVDVAHAFFDGKEPGLVNAVLDRLAKARI